MQLLLLFMSEQWFRVANLIAEFLVCMYLSNISIKFVVEWL